MTETASQVRWLTSVPRQISTAQAAARPRWARSRCTMVPVNSTSSSMAKDPNAAKLAIAGEWNTSEHRANRAGITSAVRPARRVAASPGSCPRSHASTPAFRFGTGMDPHTSVSTAAARPVQEGYSLCRSSGPAAARSAHGVSGAAHGGDAAGGDQAVDGRGDDRTTLSRGRTRVPLVAALRVLPRTAPGSAWSDVLGSGVSRCAGLRSGDAVSACVLPRRPGRVSPRMGTSTRGRSGSRSTGTASQAWAVRTDR